jgi:hypothetical protein
LNRITNKWDANWGKKYSKLAHDCGVEKKGFENTYSKRHFASLFI